MPIRENGFLGKDALLFSEQIRERNKNLFECCNEINNFAQKLKYQINDRDFNLQKLFAVVFFLRILESVQGVIILVERGLELEAATLLRSAFDSSVNLKCCIEDEKFVDDYILYGLIKKLDDSNNILSYKIFERVDSSQNDTDVRQKIQEIETQLKEKGLDTKKKIKAFKLRFSRFQLAKKAKMDELYVSFYSITSDAAHTGLKALQDHIIVDRTGEFRGIKHGLNDKNAKRHLCSSADFILEASKMICTFFKKQKFVEIELLTKKLTDLARLSRLG